MALPAAVRAAVRYVAATIASTIPVFGLICNTVAGTSGCPVWTLFARILTTFIPIDIVSIFEEMSVASSIVPTGLCNDAGLNNVQSSGVSPNALSLLLRIV